jgi:hypothetical protein
MAGFNVTIIIAIWAGLVVEDIKSERFQELIHPGAGCTHLTILPS